MCAEKMIRVTSTAISTAIAVTQKGSKGMHLLVQISHGRGISHPNTIPAITASVHTRTTTPMAINPTRRIVLFANWYRNRSIEHFDILSARMKRIAEINILIWICSMSVELRRHCRFPRPESTAVEITTVEPKPQSEVAMTIISSDTGRWRRCCDWHRLMILAAVHSALNYSQ
jgi:hypothetical protein